MERFKDGFRKLIAEGKKAAKDYVRDGKTYIFSGYGKIFYVKDDSVYSIWGIDPSVDYVQYAYYKPTENLSEKEESQSGNKNLTSEQIIEKIESTPTAYPENIIKLEGIELQVWARNISVSCGGKSSPTYYKFMKLEGADYYDKAITIPRNQIENLANLITQ